MIRVRADDCDPAIDLGRESGVLRPALRCPNAAGCEGHDWLVIPTPSGEEVVDGPTFLVAGIESGPHHCRRRCSGAGGKPQQPCGVMVVLDVRNAGCVEESARTGLEA